MTVILLWEREAGLVMESVNVVYFACLESWDELVFAWPDFIYVWCMIYKIRNSVIAWFVSGFAWTSFFLILIWHITHFSLWTTHTAIVSWVSCSSTSIGTRKSWMASIRRLHSLLTERVSSLCNNIINFGSQLSHNNLFPWWSFSSQYIFWCCII